MLKKGSASAAMPVMSFNGFYTVHKKAQVGLQNDP